MSWAVALLLTYFCLGNEKNKVDGPEITMRRAMLIGVFLAVGFLVKVSLLLFFPLAGLAFLYTWYRMKNNLIILRMFVAFGIACLLIAPWVMRNLHQYHSFTAIPLIVGPEIMSGSPHLIVKAMVAMIKGSIRFFWFPMQHIPSSPWQRPLGFIGTLLIAFFLILTIRYFYVKKKFRYNEAFLIVLFAVNIISYIKVNHTWGDWEARYLFPSLASIVFLSIVPLSDFLTSLRLDRLLFPAAALLGIWGYSYLLLTF